MGRTRWEDDETKGVIRSSIMLLQGRGCPRLISIRGQAARISGRTTTGLLDGVIGGRYCVLNHQFTVQPAKHNFLEMSKHGVWVIS